MGRHASAAALLCVLATTTACTGSTRTVQEPPREQGLDTTALTVCAQLVPDDVVESLGWTDPEPTRVTQDRCLRESSGGSVSVQRRAVPAVGGDDLPRAASTVFAARCEEVDASAEGAAAVSTAGLDACAVVPPRPRSVSILVLRTPADAVVEVRLEARQRTDRSRRLAALGAVAEAVAARA